MNTNLFAIAPLLLAGCASAPATRSSKDPISNASLALASARCSQGTCACREVDAVGRAPRGAQEADILEGRKRFELRTGYGTDPVEIDVGALRVVTKTGDPVAPACGYVDLPPGRHKVRLHTRAADARAGFHPVLLINEYGARTEDWYDTFRYKCGSQGACTQGEMHALQKQVSEVPRGIHDACGSVKVEGFAWQSDRAKGEELEDVTVEMVLNVYPFEPRFAHGSSSCGKGSGSRVSDE